MAYFEEFEEILFLSDVISDKQKIEEKLNRNLIMIRTLKSLVEELGLGVKNRTRINVICTTNLPAELQANLDQIVTAFGSLTTEKVSVFEIGFKHPLYKEALRFGNIDTFLEFAVNQRRISYANKLGASSSEVDNEESLVMRNLIAENDSNKAKVAELLEEIEQKKKRISDLEAEMLKLDTEVNNVYIIDLENKRNEIANLKDNIEDLERVLSAEKNKNKKYLKDLTQYRDANIDLEAQLQAHEAVLKEKREELRAKDRRIQRLEEDLVRENNEKKAIMTAKVDVEVVYDLSKELDRKKEEIRRIEMEKMNLEALTRKDTLTIKELEEEIRDMRRGEVDLETFGFTRKLDTCELQTTNVIYFKIIHDLPYLNSHLACFKELLESKNHSVQVMILKNDEGLDSKRYRNLNFYGSIDSVKSTDTHFRLKPSHVMFRNVNQYEGKIQTLIVLDYIQSNEYYISSRAIHKVFSVVKNKDLLLELGLKGQLISLDGYSVLDLDYDDTIKEANTRKLKMGLIENKVRTWIKSSDLIGLFA